MGWKSTLLKVGAYAGAPFTGGATLAAIPAIDAYNGYQNGGGWKGALVGGAMGGLEAATGGATGGAGSVVGKLVGTGVKTGIKQGAKEALKQGAKSALKAYGGQAIGNIMNGQQPTSGGNLGNNYGLPRGAMNLSGNDAAPSRSLTGGSSSFPSAGGMSSSMTDEAVGPAGSGVLNPLDSRQTTLNDGVMPAGDTGGVPDTGGTGYIQKLLAAAKAGGNPDAFGEAAQVLGGMENGEALNRYKKADMTQAYDRLMGDAQDRQRLDQRTALQDAQHTAYITGGGNPYKAPHLNSGQTTDLGYGPKATTPFEQQAAQTLQDQLLKRLGPDGSYMPTKPDYLDRGKLENVGQYGALGASAAQILNDALRKKPAQPPDGSTT